MSFSDHLDNFIKQREQFGQQPNRMQKRNSYIVVDATDQSKAREAMAKEQEHATLRAEQETKQYHQRIRGRCVLPSEAQAQQERQSDTRPADPDRIAYIQQLKKDLKLKKYHSE
ncbi:hypothetical protein UB37_18040 [Photobacterium iliopiscarium]|jgi:KaiC/GvpD/RAD55 family RecA-like ATPase|uniref:Uncharacterized protein n=1 Tax=Photobacterium iliopiscarium TaxID=56192 RepID=A0A0D8PNC7_9GAMM|nr:hypothetical protein [Photobacterium iliopiscarium]KJG14139.1 hypothetical protein UB38_04710 [Photobacterium iliopiscarium]KJG19482.1 hypothetical protein UB37_18040 [Photobacterium iliopiscarium]PST94020.1 hypothetical protein C9I87_12160 [Photobacterium iliopiscarium]PSU00665.1 hypothetical protein C9I85_07220 [Photobacterium iliopiscarium]PSV82351.1 hypothetical protein C9J51_12065 [Photobacterium iliopiscarium]